MVFAQSMGSKMAASPPAEIEYNLAYPGLLPDNPLHFLKAARDRIVSILINDPLKKAEFNLLTSDKRIYATEFLADKGQDELAVTTLSKSNNYFSEAIVAVKEAKTSGRDVDTVLHNMDLASRKHLEVVAIVKKQVAKKYAPGIDQEERRLKKFQKNVSSLLPK